MPVDTDRVLALIQGTDPRYGKTELVPMSLVAEMLQVTPRYVQNHVRMNVDHVYVNDEAAQAAGNAFRKNAMRSRVYFLADDLNRWFNEEAQVSRQTIVINLWKYIQDDINFRAEMKELNDMPLGSTNPMDEEMILRKYLNATGLWIMDHHVLPRTNRKKVPNVLLQDYWFDLISNYGRLMIPKNMGTHPEEVYRKAFMRGTIKINLGVGKTYFYDVLEEEPDAKLVGYQNTIPYSLYLDNLTRIEGFEGI